MKSKITSKGQVTVPKPCRDRLGLKDLAGKIVIKFTIGADGSVSDVIVISSDLNNRQLERDLIRRIKRIKFKPASGKITIEWPLIFSQG